MKKPSKLRRKVAMHQVILIFSILLQVLPHSTTNNLPNHLQIKDEVQNEISEALPQESAPNIPTYQNPVFDPGLDNFGDPAVVRYDGKYYMVGTAPGHYSLGQIQMWTSDDLVTWVPEGIIYQATLGGGDWNKYMFWAAELYIDGSDFYLSYSASPDTVMQNHRIGIAHSTSITGPYTDLKSSPTFDNGHEAIDQHIVNIGGDPYMYFTNHSGPDGQYVVQLSNDLQSTTGAFTHLFDRRGDEVIAEAPWLVQHGGTYYLLYSANSGDTTAYRVGYYTSSNHDGPFTYQGYILVDNTNVFGPGHCSVVESPDGSELFIVYQAKKDTGVNWDRWVCIDRLGFNDDGSLFALGPTVDAHPYPSGAGTMGTEPIKNPGAEIGDLTGWIAYSTGGPTTHIFVEDNFDAGWNWEGQKHFAMWGVTSQHGKLSQLLTDLSGGETYSLSCWTRNGGRNTVFGVDPVGSSTVSTSHSGSDYTKLTIEFTVPIGQSQATIWIESEAGSGSSWIWVDSFEVFRIDNTSPTGSLQINGGALVTNSVSVTLTGTASDLDSGVKDVRFSNDGSSWSQWETPIASNLWLLTDTDGSRTVYLEIRDYFNNTFQCTDSITLDRTLPTGTISINNGNASTNSASVTLSLTSDDSGSGVVSVQFSNDGTTWSGWESPITSKIWDAPDVEATHTIYYQILDNAGNDCIITNSILLDKTNPTGAVLINNGNTSTNSASVTLGLTSDDSGSGVASVQFSNDGTTWSGWESPTSSKIWDLPDVEATHTVHYQIQDNVNNVHLETETILLDKTNPIGTISINNGNASTEITNAILSLTYTDLGSGVAQVRFSNNGTTWSTWETPQATRNWQLAGAAGIKTIYFQIRDESWRISSIFSDSIEYTPIIPQEEDPDNTEGETDPPRDESPINHDMILPAALIGGVGVTAFVGLRQILKRRNAKQRALEDQIFSGKWK